MFARTPLPLAISALPVGMKLKMWSPFGDGCDRLHLEALVGNAVVTLGQLAVLNVRRRSRRRRRPSTAAGRSLPLLGTVA